MTRRRLEFIRWTLAGLSFLIAVAGVQLGAKGGWAVLWLFGFIATAFPASMLSLHLHPPKIFKFLERPKR